MRLPDLPYLIAAAGAYPAQMALRCAAEIVLERGDQGRDFLRRRVTAYHAQQRLAGGLIVVSGAGNHPRSV